MNLGIFKKKKSTSSAEKPESFDNLLMECREGNADQVAKILQKARWLINAVDEAGKSPLHIGAMNGHVKVVEWLLKNGADINQKDSGGKYISKFRLGWKDI